MSSSSSADVKALVQRGISRLETMQKMLSKCGAPGSIFCQNETDLVVCEPGAFVKDLHPHLIPLMRSKSSPHLYICALNRGSVSEPMPIVESGECMPGMRLLALNSEHLMRRIACEADGTDNLDASVIINMYNEGLGKGQISDAALDNEYEPGSVAKLGYGAAKYILLRVAPFPDLYESMALQHLGRGDDKSALIAAEANNGKFTGFGSTFLFYARLYAKLPNRLDETRDAARVCLRLPLSTAGMTVEELAELAVLAQVANKEDSSEVAMSKLKAYYEKQKELEVKAQSTPSADQSGKTAAQIALDDANALLDRTAMATNGRPQWSAIRSQLAEIYASADQEAMAKFVDPSRANS